MDIHRGDVVQQVGQMGLVPLRGFFYVQETAELEILLTREPYGPFLEGLDGKPRHFPAKVFRKVT